MLKSRLDERDTFIKNNRRSTLNNYQLEKKYCESNIF